MKKVFNLLILIMALATFATFAVSCDTPSEECEHVWETEYEISEEGHWYACTLCDAKKDAQMHLWDAVTTKEASCYETGLATLTCKVCDFSTQSVLVKKNHSAKTDFENDDDKHWQDCVDCGEDLNVEDHKYNIPSYDSNGHWYSCKCGVSTESEQHSWVSGGEAAPGKEVCSAAGCEAVRDAGGDAHEHSKTSSEIIEAATCAKSGIIKYSCSCGHSWTESISPDPHAYANEEWEYDELYHWHNCVCGEEAPASAKVPHSYSSTPVVEGLEKVYKCECGKTKPANDEGYLDPDGWTSVN